MKRPVAVALRLIVGLGALAYLVSTIDLERARATLAGAHGGWLLAAVAAQFGAKAFWLLRWKRLLHSTGHARTLARLFRLVLVGLFFNNFLPTSVGGDVARAIGLSRDGVPRATAAASVLLDRLVGLLALSLMAVVGGVLGAVLWPEQGPWAVAAVSALAAGALVVALTRPRVLARLAAFRGIPAGIAARVERLLSSMALVAGRGRVVGGALLYSLGLSACSAVFHWCVGRSLGLPTPLLAFFVIVPTVMLFASLPITLNGLGIRELGFVAFLGSLGTPQSTAAVFAFLVFALPLVWALLGGALFLAGGRRGAFREEAT